MKSIEKKKIINSTIAFLVDDELFQRTIIRQVLEDMGIRKVETFDDGEQVLFRLKRRGEICDIIILDLEMPKMNGFELLKAVRSSSDPKFKDIPVIILSGHSAPAFLLKTAKPLDPSLLIKATEMAKNKT